MSTAGEGDIMGTPKSSSEQQLVVHRPAQNLSSVEIQGKTYQSIEEVIDHVRQIQDPGERFEEQKAMLEHMENLHSVVADSMETFFRWVESDKAYEAADISQTQFDSMFAEQHITILQNAQRRDRLLEAINTINNIWSSSLRASTWMLSLDKTTTFISALRSLAVSNDSFHECTLRINAAIQARLKDRSRGTKKDLGVTTKDLEHAKLKKYRKTDLEMELDMDFLNSRGMRIGEHGILELNDGRTIELLPSEVPSPNSPSQNTQSTPSLLEESLPMTREQQRSKRLTASEREDVEREFNITPMDQEHIDEEVLNEVEDELNAQSEPEEYEEAEPGAKRRRRCRTRGAQGTKRTGCGCSADVTSHWQTLILKKSKMPDAVQLRLLATMVGFRTVCYHHARAMSSHLGLMNNNLTYERLQERLRFIHDNRLRIGTLKTQNETFQWWRKGARPPHPSDMLGIYKFQHQDNSEEFAYDQGVVLSNIQKLLGTERNLKETWDRDGTINLPIFKWWIEDKELMDCIDDEFEMYRYHLRKVNNRSNSGWQRSQYHSVTQQLMRQDPVYYMAYAGLRPDKFWRLVSYPYYTKYATSKDGASTYFRHIDINIPDAVDYDRGVNMIQGSVSLDDETSTDSTVLLKGFHHNLKAWWADCRARGVPDSKAFVHRIETENYIKEDVEKYGDWENVPCKAGEARITMSTIPHGATATTSERRRTMLPWFVGLQDDLQSLELVESGTWNDLSYAHTALVAAKSSPSGLNSRYNTIPYRFPGAIELDGLSALSSALVCRKVWNSPTVLAERDLLLGSDINAIYDYIKDWRARAIKRALQAFAAGQEVEKKAFKEKSYFALREMGHPIDEMLAVDPDLCQAEKERGIGGDDGMRFAEDAASGEVAAVEPPQTPRR